MQLKEREIESLNDQIEIEQNKFNALQDLLRRYNGNSNTVTNGASASSNLYNNNDNKHNRGTKAQAPEWNHNTSVLNTSLNILPSSQATVKSTNTGVSGRNNKPGSSNAAGNNTSNVAVTPKRTTGNWMQRPESSKTATTATVGVSGRHSNNNSDSKRPTTSEAANPSRYPMNDEDDWGQLNEGNEDDHDTLATTISGSVYPNRSTHSSRYSMVDDAVNNAVTITSTTNGNSRRNGNTIFELTTDDMELINDINNIYE